MKPNSVPRITRLVAGSFILASLAIGWFVTPFALLFTAFIGVNLLQSAFTDTCPLMVGLRRFGVPDTTPDESRASALGPHGTEPEPRRAGLS